MSNPQTTGKGKTGLNRHQWGKKLRELYHSEPTKEMADFIGAAVGLQEAMAGGEIISRGGRYVAIPFGVADKAMKECFAKCEAMKHSMEIAP